MEKRWRRIRGHHKHKTVKLENGSRWRWYLERRESWGEGCGWRKSRGDGGEKGKKKEVEKKKKLIMEGGKSILTIFILSLKKKNVHLFQGIILMILYFKNNIEYYNWESYFMISLFGYIIIFLRIFYRTQNRNFKCEKKITQQKTSWNVIVDWNGIPLVACLI